MPNAEKMVPEVGDLVLASALGQDFGLYLVTEKLTSETGARIYFGKTLPVGGEAERIRIVTVWRGSDADRV